MYFIDGAKSGLFIKSDCSYPCRTCLKDSPYKCTSCFEEEGGLPFLQLDTCVSQCNFGRYYDLNTKKCLPCDSKCLSCVDSATKCLSCKEGKWPFLNGNDCVTTCPDGKIGNVKAN